MAPAPGWRARIDKCKQCLKVIGNFTVSDLVWSGLMWKKAAVLLVVTGSWRGQVADHSELFSHHCMIVFRFACSVASLSRCLNHYLPGLLDLHPAILVDYLLGWGSPST